MGHPKGLRFRLQVKSFFTLIVNKNVHCIDRCERKVSILFCATFLSRGVQKVFFFFLQLPCGYTALFIGVFFRSRMCALCWLSAIYLMRKKKKKNPRQKKKKKKKKKK